MSIFPAGVYKKHLFHTFKLSAFDLPIPDHLMGKDEDQSEWYDYAKSLPPARLIHKFGEAIDSVLALVPEKKSIAKLDQETSEKIFSRWFAASTLGGYVSQRLDFSIEKTQQNKRRSDIDHAMFLIEDMLKGVASPQVQEWVDRRTAYESIQTNAFDKFLSKTWSQDRTLKEIAYFKSLESPAP